MYNNMVIKDQLWRNGPVPGELYNFPGGNGEIRNNMKNFMEFTTEGQYGTKHSLRPIHTGTSVVGMKYNDGVLIAADNVVSYGSMARFHDVQRVFEVNSQTIVGFSGDIADAQYIMRHVESRVVQDTSFADGIQMGPNSLYHWLTRLLYSRRSQFNPLLVEAVVGGMENGVPFLGHIDYRGRAYEDNAVCSGIGKHLTLPVIRARRNNQESITQEEAGQLICKCMEVLYYRDCRAFNKYTAAYCTNDGVKIEGPISVKENWSVAHAVRGY